MGGGTPPVEKLRFHIRNPAGGSDHGRKIQVAMSIPSLATRVATVALLAVSFAYAKKPQAPSLPEKIDKIFADAIQKSAPGAAVLVRKNGRTLFQKGYGVRDLNTGHPIDAQTNFRLA